MRGRLRQPKPNRGAGLGGPWPGRVRGWGLGIERNGLEGASEEEVEEAEEVARTVDAAAGLI